MSAFITIGLVIELILCPIIGFCIVIGRGDQPAMTLILLLNVVWLIFFMYAKQGREK